MTSTTDGIADPPDGTARDGELCAFTKRMSRRLEMVLREFDDEDDAVMVTSRR